MACVQVLEFEAIMGKKKIFLIPAKDTIVNLLKSY